jgi:hypothetical protein
VLVSRLSAKRVLVFAAGMALALALGIAALQLGDARVAALIGPEAIEWVVPLTAGAVVGLAAWMLLDGSTPSPPDSLHAETECPACGRAVLRDWRLCPHCGAFIVAEDEGTPASPDQS